MAKFEDMNKKQLANKVVELEGQIDSVNAELDSVSSLLHKVCKVAEFDPELAQLSKEELDSLGLEVPLAVVNTAHKANQLKEKIKGFEGMLAAVNYYLNQKNSDG